jgi:membrane-associated phospholipid phosphatase
VIGMPVFAATFTVVKKSIPIFAPFIWDPTFEEWDRWLHGGVAPWQLIHPILGSPGITYGMNWAYNVWFYVLGVIWAYQAFSQADHRLRLQFFLTLMLGWILLGNVAAMLFSSAGPCFFGDVTGLPDPFLPLMRYLNDANQLHPIWALQAQQHLLQAYTMQGVSEGIGISAMPSMHVAIATLFALVCWRIQRSLGVAMTIYAVAIMIGSVHLGWHYAIDGYFGAMGMIAIWCVVGRALDRQAQNAANRRTVQLV